MWLLLLLYTFFYFLFFVHVHHPPKELPSDDLTNEIGISRAFLEPQDTQRFGGTKMLRAWCSEVLRPFHTALSLLLVFTMTVCLHLASKWLGYLTQPAKKCSFARQLGAVNCTTRRHFLGHVLQLCRFLFTLPRGSLRELVRRRERWTTQSLKLMCWQTHIFIFFGKAAA